MQTVYVLLIGIAVELAFLILIAFWIGLGLRAEMEKVRTLFIQGIKTVKVDLQGANNSMAKIRDVLERGTTR